MDKKFNTEVKQHRPYHGLKGLPEMSIPQLRLAKGMVWKPLKDIKWPQGEKLKPSQLYGMKLL